VTNFFDTLGIGSFATTTAIFRSEVSRREQRRKGALAFGFAALPGHHGRDLRAEGEAAARAGVIASWR
jgi:hypothetical protein